ncbi:MAG TPA: hypothetical protein VNP36_14265 [Burkholderiales bacterium]|nr:hypothetical protein [Burkholderiales bacterium]
MSSLRTSLLILGLLALGFTQAQAQIRVRGTVSAFDGTTLTVDGKTPVRLEEKTEIVFAQPVALADIKPGDFLGVTSMKGPGGQLTALEVRRFPKPLNPGHRPFDGRDDQTMTNAAVEATVSAASGRELTMAYPGGSQKITVPESAAVSTLVPGTRAHLVPGAPVNLTHDPSGVALRIQVGPKR